VEEGERFEEAALREAREESGLVGTLLRPLGAVSYQFLDGGTKNRILKTVHFFLIRYEHGNLEDHDEEVACAEWFPIEKAFECAEYGGEREVLRKAADEIKRFT